MELQDKKVLYRCDSTYHSSTITSRSFEALITSHLFFSEYEVVKETPQGWWIGADSLDKGGQWIAKNTRKAFAYDTKEKALESFYHRKRRQIKILESQLRRAKAGLSASKEMLEKGIPEDIYKLR